MSSHPNATITKFGYKFKKSDLTTTELKDLRVMVCATAIKGYGPKPKPFGVYLETEKNISVPYYYGKEIFKDKPLSITYSDDNHLSNELRSNLEFNGSLREPQVELVDSVLKHLQTEPRCLINGKPGFGKTVVMLNILSQLKQKALIIVHKQFLLEQWLERINQFLPTAKVGLICQNKFEPDSDIIIGMLQSLSMREYPKIDDLAIVAVDECHHIGSSVFSKALLRYSGVKMIGLSATPIRKDGLSNVLDWTFGKHFEPKIASKEQRVNVRVVNTNTVVQEKRMYSGVVNIQNAINQLTADTARTKLIIDNVMKEYTGTTKCILVISDRVAHIKDINKQLLDKGVSTALYIGGMTSDARETSTTARVLCGTYSMLTEGFDLSKLSVLVLATPKKDVIQVVGRIMRKIHEIPPLIVDIFDRTSVFERWGYLRFKYYKTQGYHFGRGSIVETVVEEPIGYFDVFE